MKKSQRLFTSLIRMFVGVFTGARDPLHPPTEITDEFKEMFQHPSLQQILKYSFVDSKQIVKRQIQAFLDQTQVNELIPVSTMHRHELREICSTFRGDQ